MERNGGIREVGRSVKWRGVLLIIALAAMGALCRFAVDQIAPSGGLPAAGRPLDGRAYLTAYGALLEELEQRCGEPRVRRIREVVMGVEYTYVETLEYDLEEQGSFPWRKDGYRSATLYTGQVTCTRSVLIDGEGPYCETVRETAYEGWVMLTEDRMWEDFELKEGETSYSHSAEFFESRAMQRAAAVEG